MATDVVMPQVGESIAEGTIVRWIKKVGEKVDRDEPLFEISTDKVDAEIPAPAAGVVTEIRHKEGETVPVNTVVAVIGQAGEAPAATPPAPAAPARAPAPSPQADGAATSQDRSEDRPLPAPRATPQPSLVGAGLQARPQTSESAIRQRSSPLVRKIAKEYNVDISQLQGTGISGRVTRDDILGFLGRERQEGQEGRAGQERQEGQERRDGREGTTTQGRTAERGVGVPAERVRGAGAPGSEIVKMSVMRKRIAEHMVASRRTSAHVHSVFEVNFSRVAKIREAKKNEYELAGAKLTFLSFILRAVVEALRAVPVVNASVDGDNIVFHKEVNIGIAVAL